MFDNTNAYTLRTLAAGGITRYFVSFVDGQALSHETEVSRPVYLEFLHFIRTERNLRRWDERHTEQSVLSDEMLFHRALNPPNSVEDAVFKNLQYEQMQLALQQLPETQRRRLVLHHDSSLTYEQIAEMEGCTKMAVKYTIDKAESKISEILEDFLD